MDGSTDCNVIQASSACSDFTMLKVMLPAIVVGGLGVWALVDAGDAKYYVKDANLLAVGLGAALFGVASSCYGYCPGTGIAALATAERACALGVVGMVFGAIVYALTFDWVRRTFSRSAPSARSGCRQSPGSPTSLVRRRWRSAPPLFSISSKRRNRGAT